MPEPIPDWVNETWPEHIYELAVFESADSSVEIVEVSRDEYIALKLHLAAVRGYPICDATACVAELAGKPLDPENNVFVPKNNDTQTADLILIARNIYHLCPEAVVTTDAAFEAGIRKLAEE